MKEGTDSIVLFVNSIICNIKSTKTTNIVALLPDYYEIVKTIKNISFINFIKII